MPTFDTKTLATAALWLALASAAAADENPAGSVLDCRSLESAEERLKCYDDTVDSQSAPPAAPEPPNDEPAAAAAPEPASPEPVEEVPPAAEVAPAAAVVAASASATAEDDFGLPPSADSVPDADQIEAAISELSRMASGKLAIELENGQLWRQTTSSSMRLSEGDVVVIRRGSLGSFKLTKAGTNRSMKVKRVK